MSRKPRLRASGRRAASVRACTGMGGAGTSGCALSRAAASWRMQGQADQEVHGGEDHIHVAPPRKPCSHAVSGQNRVEAKPAISVRWTMDRCAWPGCRCTRSGKAAPYCTEVAAIWTATRAGTKTGPGRCKRTARQRQRGCQRSRCHDPAGAEAVHPAPRHGGNPARGQQSGREGAEHPGLRPAEILRHARRQNAEAVIEAAIADDLGEAERDHIAPSTLPSVTGRASAQPVRARTSSWSGSRSTPPRA